MQSAEARESSSRVAARCASAIRTVRSNAGPGENRCHCDTVVDVPVVPRPESQGHGEVIRNEQHHGHKIESAEGNQRPQLRPSDCPASESSQAEQLDQKPGDEEMRLESEPEAAQRRRL